MISGHKPFSILREELNRDPETRHTYNEMKRTIRDAERMVALRSQRNLTQQDVADSLDLSSLIEQGDSVYLSTLRDYIEGLGGELELAASFPGGEVIKVG